MEKLKTKLGELLAAKGKRPAMFIKERGTGDRECNGIPEPVKEEKTERITVCAHCGHPLNEPEELPKLHFQDRLDDDPYGVLNELGGGD